MKERERIINAQKQFEKEWEEQGYGGMEEVRRLSGKYNVYVCYTDHGFSEDKWVASRDTYEEAKAIADKRTEGHLLSCDEEETLGSYSGNYFECVVFFGTHEFYDEDSDTLEYNEPLYETAEYSFAKGGPALYEDELPKWEEDDND